MELGEGSLAVPLRFGSLFSGIEAASVAWGPLGWNCAWTAEIEPFPCAVLEHRHPDTPNLGDVTAPDFCARARNHGPIDLIAGGSPCQSFSVAGKRLGLEDPRGNLALHFFRVVHDLRPRWFVFENVPGLLSSGRGRDFGALLWLVGQLGYGWFYRVLDAQYFGVPQRRRRLFIVGYLGDWRPATAVLFEPESLRRHSAPGRAAGQGTAACLTRRARSLRYDHTGQTLISHTLRGEGFDASEDGTGRGAPLVVGGGSFPTLSDNQSPHLTTRRGDQTAVVFDPTQVTSAENRCNPQPGAPCHPLAARAHPPTVAHFIDALAIRGSGSPNQHPIKAGELSDALDTTGPGAVAFESRLARNGRGAPSAIVPPLKAQSGQTGKGDAAPLVAALGMQVRRLTPREGERLQGFPDDYTLIPSYRRKLTAAEVLEVDAHLHLPLAEAKALGATPDGPRYKALGNSWAVPVVRWLGRRIELLERERAGRPEAA